MKLCIPEKVLLQHLVMLGKTGAGKSSALRHIVEHLLHVKRRVCIIDPKGDWWGLKKSGDGKSAGFSVIMFGDFKDARASDVPINKHSGKHVAELVATGNRPCVIGFRGWMHADMVRFWIDFASTLFNRNAGELYLFVDEVHNFAPKGRVMDPEAGKSLHYTNRLMSEGRGLGIVCAIASQRPQKVHNDTLTCCETLVAMRVTHKADRQALKDWIDGCGDDSGDEVLKNSAALARGEAYVWSPEIAFGPERVKFPMFETFDSFAPPQLQKKVTESGWADVDLGAVKEKLAAVIEEAKANDPAELKQRIAELQKQLAAKPAAAPEIKTVNVLEPATLAKIDQLDDKVIELCSTLNDFHQRIAGVARETNELVIIARKLAQPAPVHVITPHVRTIAMRSNPSVPPPSRDPAHHVILRSVPNEGTSRDPEVADGSKLPRAESSILKAIAQRHPRPCSRAQASLISGYSITSSSFSNALSALRSAGLIEGMGDDMRLTHVGLVCVGEVARPVSAQSMQDFWLSRLPKAEASLLALLINAYPKPLSKAELSSASGYSETSSSFSNALSALRTAELITRDRDPRATEILFDV
jgi:DNA-binding transcriptional ArsR family regulator